jgi:hypothetical protein
MSPLESAVPIVSTIIAFATVVFTTVMMARQTRQIEHERNALALLDAIDRLTSPEVLRTFDELQGVDERFPTKDDILKKYPGSADQRAMAVVAQYFEAVACLARREVIDPSLVVDAAGIFVRGNWERIKQFVMRRRAAENNDFILENFEWLARYSAWWKDEPRPKHPNYDPDQFSRAGPLKR